MPFHTEVWVGAGSEGLILDMEDQDREFSGRVVSERPTSPSLQSKIQGVIHRGKAESLEHNYASTGRENQPLGVRELRDEEQCDACL